MKINGIKFSRLDEIFLGVFLECSKDIIEKWQSYILSNNLTLTFDRFLLDLSTEDIPKKYRFMFKQYKKRLPKIILLWQSYNNNMTFDKWCLLIYDRHKNN